MLTSTQAAARLGVSVRTLARLVGAGVLSPARPSPRRVVFDAAELDAYLARSRPSRKPPPPRARIVDHF